MPWLVKLYGTGGDNKNPETRYSPGQCIGTRAVNLLGVPNPKHISTSNVERHNLSVRMTNRRYTS